MSERYSDDPSLFTTTITKRPFGLTRLLLEYLFTKPSLVIPIWKAARKEAEK